MDINEITPNYAVAPQIEPEDMPDLAEAGFTRIISNRPDSEVPPELQSTAMAAAAAAAGLEFVYIPIDNGGMTPEIVAEHTAAMATAHGPVFAYCRSGTRSSVVWALSEAGKRPTDEILSATAEAGYELGGLRGQIDHLASQG